MHRKALIGAAATAFSVAAFYGATSKSDSSSSSSISSTSSHQPYPFDFNANNSSSSSFSSSLVDANSLQGLSGMMASKSPRLLPLPSASWNSDWDRGTIGSKPASSTKPGASSGAASSGAASEQCSSSSPLPSPAPTATRNLFLIRHGQYHTEESLEADRKLTVLGREQLDLTGCRLRELGIRFDRLVASTMTRAQESASIVHKHFPELCIENEPLLEEGAPVKPEPPIESWSPTDEQFREDGKRIEAGFRKYFHRASADVKEDTNEIVVCHGNVIRYCVCRALQIPPEAWLRMGLNHGSVTWIAIRPSGRVVLRSLGVTGHMPPNKISSV